MPLTDTRIKAAKPAGKRYRIKDGLGLYDDANLQCRQQCIEVCWRDS